MAENKQNMSDTMEINAILDEALGRSGGSQPRKNSVGTDTRRTADTYRSAAPTAADDDYVFIGEDGSYTDSRRTSKPSKSQNNNKSKKPLVIALVIIGVILIAGAAGLLWYMSSGELTSFADNVTVSGVSLAGMNMNEAKTALASVESRLADQIKVEVTAGEKKVVLTKDDFTLKYNTEEILAQAKEYSESKGVKSGEKSYDIALALTDADCKSAVDKVVSEIDSEPVNAAVSDFNADKKDMFTFTEEAKGVKIKSAEFTKQLSKFLSEGNLTGTLSADYDEVDPDYTVDYLRSNIVKLSSFTTTSTNNSNGNENMRVSLAACNSSIIEPGETWSFNKHTGNSNLESNGYKPAGVIVNGKHEIGIGGGICQSSTTIYNAGILCGMEVVERYCHYYKSAYVDAGRDATIDYGNLDLKLRNPFDYQLFLKCYMDGVVLHAEIYGLQSKDFDDVKISTSSPSYFSNGYRVSTYRTYYLNGAKVDSDELPSSTYYTSAPRDSSETTATQAPATSAEEPTSSGEPVDPDPVDPEPVDPEPVDPEPIDPEPIDPEPAQPTPIDNPVGE